MKQQTAVIHKEGKWFVAESPETGVASQGKTESDALANLKEAVELYKESLDKPGLTVMLDRVTPDHVKGEFYWGNSIGTED